MFVRYKFVNICFHSVVLKNWSGGVCYSSSNVWNGHS